MFARIVTGTFLILSALSGSILLLGVVSIFALFVYRMYYVSLASLCVLTFLYGGQHPQITSVLITLFFIVVIASEFLRTRMSLFDN